MTEPKFILVTTTINSFEKAEILAESLVKKNLAGCVSIVPETISIYRWENSIVKDKEIKLFIKTSLENFPLLEKEILALSSYDTPEILVFPIIKGNDKYLKWLESSTLS